MTIVVRAVMFVFLVLAAAEARAEEMSWFTDAPPDRGMMKKMRFAHGGPVEMGRGGLYIKSLWLRSGTSPGNAVYASHAVSDDPDAFLLSPDGSVSEIGPSENKHGYGFRFEMPREGFYNLYLVDKFVEGDALNVSIIKAEILKHSCAEGHGHVSRKMPPQSLKDIPFEIIRERIDGEDFHRNMTSGDRVTYRVLYKGGPAVGADVEFITEEGWMKSAAADKNGKVTYELIRDNYPSSWDMFDKKKSEDSLVTATYTVPEKGVYNGEPYSRIRYTSTLPGRFYPSEEEYTSYLYGLMVLVFTFSFTAAGIYIHRSRRERPYREETFADGD